MSTFLVLTTYRGWINSQLQERKPLTDIDVQTLDDDGVYQSTPLTRGVWERSLIRGQWKQDFAPLWEKRVVALQDRHSTIAPLRETKPHFSQACINCIHDLRTFGGNKGSRARLEGTGHEFYLGRPYFDAAAANAIMSRKTSGGSVEQQLRALVDQRRGRELCASHDLSPCFESVLGSSGDQERSKALGTRHTVAKGGMSSEGGKLGERARQSSKISSGTFGRKKGGGRRGGSGGGGSSEVAKACKAGLSTLDVGYVGSQHDHIVHHSIRRRGETGCRTGKDLRCHVSALGEMQYIGCTLALALKLKDS